MSVLPDDSDYKLKQRFFPCLLRPLSFLLIALTIQLTSSCTVMTVAGATAGAAVAVTGVAVKTTGAAVGAVIPDSDEDENE